MTNRRLADPVGRVPTLECADDPASAPRLSARDERAGKLFEIVNLERKATERISGKRIEAGRDQDQVGDKSLRCRIDGALERRYILTGRQRCWFWNVPYRTVRAAILGRPGTRIPGPLVHRDEMDVGLAFDQRLGSVAVMDVPIDYQDSVQPVFLARVMGGDGDIPEETESHRAVVDGVVSGRPN